MKMSIRFDDTAFRLAAQRAVRELGADSRLLLREEVRLFVKEWRSRIPPFVAFGKERVGQDKKIGTTALRRDLRHVAAPIDPARIRWERLREALGKENKPLVDLLLSKIPMHPRGIGRRTLVGASEFPTTHKRYRSGARGRVGSDKHHLVIARAWNRHAKKKSGDIGWNKAAFNAALLRTGARIPGYIARHGPRGTYFEGGTGEKFSIIMSGEVNVPGAQVAVNQALALRGKKLTAEVRRIINQLARTGKIQSRRASFNLTA